MFRSKYQDATFVFRFFSFLNPRSPSMNGAAPAARSTTNKLRFSRRRVLGWREAQHGKSSQIEAGQRIPLKPKAASPLHDHTLLSIWSPLICGSYLVSTGMSGEAGRLTWGRSKHLLRSGVHAVNTPSIPIEGHCAQGAHCVHHQDLRQHPTMRLPQSSCRTDCYLYSQRKRSEDINSC